MMEKEFYKYGEKLQFVHTKEMFDEESQKLLDFLLKYAEIIKYANSNSNSNYRYYGKALSETSILLGNSGIDDLFEILQGKQVEFQKDYLSEKIEFATEDPKISFTLKKKSDNQYVILPNVEIFNVSILKGKEYKYILDSKKIYRCSKEFENANLKLLEFFRQNYMTEIVLGKEELTQLFSIIMPKVKAAITIENISEEEIEKYKPKELVVKVYLDFDEPFKRLVHQGMILGPDGNKMSKSKGNTVSPEEYIDEYGSDVFRMYLMFGFDYKQGGPWNEKGIEAMAKFFTRVEKLVEDSKVVCKESSETNNIGDKEKELLRTKNQTIKLMTENIEDFRFNTAIARNMELSNAINDYMKEKEINKEILEKTVETLIILLAPLAPHFAEEEWQKLGKEEFVYNQKWPQVSEKELSGGKKDIPVQLNGKLKFCVSVDAEISTEEMLEIIKNDERVIKLHENNNVVKDIYVPGRIYNIVVKK